MTLARMMNQEIEALEKLGYPREKSLKGVVLEHGKVYEIDREASAEQEKGYLKDCFQNAGRAALYNDDLTYVEGFAIHGLPMPVHHAWVINAEGKVLEVTWRDGGDECGFCIDGERELDEDDAGYDEDDESTWTDTCRFCNGTGKADYEHSALEHAEYIGIAVDDDTLRSLILRNGIWGVLHTAEDLEVVLAARTS